MPAALNSCNRSAKSEFSGVSSSRGMMFDNHLPDKAHPLGGVDRRPKLVVERPIVIVKTDLTRDADTAAALGALPPRSLGIIHVYDFAEKGAPSPLSGPER